MKAAKAPAEIATTRLLLVRPTADVASEVFERYASDPEVTRYLSWPRHQSIADTQAFLNFSAWSQLTEFPNLVPGMLQDVLRYEIALDA